LFSSDGINCGRTSGALDIDLLVGGGKGAEAGSMVDGPKAASFPLGQELKD